MIERALIEMKTKYAGSAGEKLALAAIICAGQYSGVEFWLEGRADVGDRVIVEFDPNDQFAKVVDPFPAFLASAKETDEREVEGHDLADGETAVRFGSAWAVKRADGTYWALIIQEEFNGTIEHVARALFDFALDEGLL